jgi:hypothetical protein
MERGHSVITTKIVEDALSTILPRSAMLSMGIIAEEIATQTIEFDETETYICKICGYAARNFEPAVCAVCNAPGGEFYRLDKEALRDLAPLEGGTTEETTFDNVRLHWTADAKAVLREVPQGYQMRRAKAQIEKVARTRRIATITRELALEVTDVALEDTRNLTPKGDLKKTTALGSAAPETPQAPEESELVQDGPFAWTVPALIRLKRVPEGFMRTITKTRIEECAEAAGHQVITLAVAEEGIAVGRKLMEEMVSNYKREEKPA